MAITMLKDANLADVYLKEVVHTIIYILNKVYIRVNHTKAPHELWNGRCPTWKYSLKVSATSEEMKMILEILILEKIKEYF